MNNHPHGREQGHHDQEDQAKTQASEKAHHQVTIALVELS
jgi:hypothetical protein